MANISNAIKALNPSALFVCHNEDVSTIEWLGGTTPIASETLTAKAIELDALEIVYEARKKEYGVVEDQLDEIFHDIDAWKVRIQAVKDANSKA